MRLRVCARIRCTRTRDCCTRTSNIRTCVSTYVYVRMQLVEQPELRKRQDAHLLILGLSLLVWVLSGQGVSPGKQASKPAVSNVTVCRCWPGSACFVLLFLLRVSSASYFSVSYSLRFLTCPRRTSLYNSFTLSI